MASNVKEHFSADINDNPCGHDHKTFQSAEDCVRKTIRRARRGEQFWGCEFAAKLDPKRDDDVTIWVKRRLVAY